MPGSISGSRAVSSALGVVLLLACVVAVATAVGVALIDVAPPEPAPQAAFGGTAFASTNEVVLTHRAGDAVDVRAVTLVIEIDGTPLAHQPPVPFFAAEGFASGPTGPFNRASDPHWTPGEVAGVRLASTNDPLLAPGSRVVIHLYVGDAPIAVVETTAR